MSRTLVSHVVSIEISDGRGSMETKDGGHESDLRLTIAQVAFLVPSLGSKIPNTFCLNWTNTSAVVKSLLMMPCRNCLVVFFIGLSIAMWIVTDELREWCHREWKFYKHASQMPGPPALPFVGNAFWFACRGDELLNRIIQLCQPYDDPFRLWMGPKLIVVVKNPRDIEVVLNSSTATYKPFEYRFLAAYLGQGLVTESGSIHRAHRKVIMPMVNGKPLNAFVDCFDRHSRRCVERLESKIGAGEFDIMHYMDDCTFDMVLETIMGTPGTSQHDGYKGFIHYSTKAITLAHERGMKVWLYPDWLYACTIPGRQFANAMSILHDFASSLVTKKKEEYQALKTNSDASVKPGTAVLDRLTAYNEEVERMDDIALRDAISNIWIPAQDPTALTSSFLFVMLGMHPDVQDKVRAEVREIIGDADVTVEKLARLKYLESVIKETIRLFPVGPIILREATEDLVFESCVAPKGCTLALVVYETHRDHKYWKDPEKFNPDRFAPENSIDRHPYAFVPFSGGIRGCIGRQYAMMVIKTITARIVQDYRLSCNRSLDTLPLKAGVSIRSIDGYNVAITKL
ncbi:cytochrome P450 4C1-like [Diprion similis]|uniref:cytochrome P450 4C1-like n=1 Tax=Diprion similis TaxID=362088 RepID=UPI001EF97A96|nr:cytochrome P450 4C1-like [Diprion similis]